MQRRQPVIPLCELSKPFTLERNNQLHFGAPITILLFKPMFLKLNFLHLNKYNRYLHTYLFKMNKVYLRTLPETQQFKLSMEVANPENKIVRQFNFCRQQSETVGDCSSRIQTNIEKFLNKKNKRKVGDQVEQKVSVALFLNNQKVNDDVICKDIFVENNDVLLKIMDTNYTIIVNSPYIDALAMPKCMLANFPTYPAEFKGVNIDEKLCKFNWYKSKDKKSWEKVGRGFTYCPGNSDMDHYLKLSCIPKNDNKEGPIAEAISDVTVTASPGLCPFENRHFFTQNKCGNEEFRVVSYNILADLYCDSDFTRTELHPYCPPYALAIDYRKQLFVKEILGYNADIICLQEVDRKVYNYDLDPVFSSFNYNSFFTLKGGNVAEGVASFFNNNKFRLLDSRGLVLSEELSTNPIFDEVWRCIESNDFLKARLLERKSAMQMIVLQNIFNDEVVLVANTHLYFHPDADHIRLLQGGICIKYIEDYYKKLIVDHENKGASIVFCGDFNSVPECGIFKLYTTGFVPSDFIDWSSNKVEEVKGLSLSQPFSLDSACGTPQYTNYTVGFADCLDYIFFDKNKLEVSQVIPLPTEEELKEHTALPSIVSPSDHIALIADFKWKK